MSQAFAAYRTNILAQLQHNLNQELVPHFNAEIVDIRVKYDADKVEHGEALADHQKRARILDLKVRQKNFIDGLSAELIEKLSERIKMQPYCGTIVPIQIEDKTVLEAKFADNSTARVPQRMWIDYSQFQRV